YDGVGRRRIDTSFLAAELTPFALAVWFMDDGCAEGRQARLNIQSFSWTDAHALRDLLETKFGVAGTLGSDKTYPRLRIRSVSMPRLRELIRPYLLPTLSYKLANVSAA